VPYITSDWTRSGYVAANRRLIGRTIDLDGIENGMEIIHALVEWGDVGGRI
jgi:hypothetical protein